MIIKMAAWLPDQADLDNPGATEASNVLPGVTYRPFQSLAALGSAASASRIQGAGSFRSSELTIFNFAGDATKLYKLDATDFTWDDVSQAATTYACAATGKWVFFEFGDNAIAINGADVPQVFELASGTGFLDLGGTPPTGPKYGGVVGDFAVLARLAAAPTTVQWSAINNSADWAASAITQSDAQVLPDGGEIKGFVGGEYGVVFQERAIRRMSYVGAPLFFQFDKVSQTEGCLAEWSIAAHEGLIIFLAHDGLYALQGGTNLQSIGNEKVDRWLFSRLDQSHLDRVTASIDPKTMIYYLSFPSIDSDGTPDEILLFNINTGTFAHAYTDCQFIYTAFSQDGYTTDTIDAVIGNTDATDLSMDNTLYTGSGRQGLAGFTTAEKFGFFDGSALEATVTTTEAQLFEGRRAYVRGGRPIVQGASAPSLALGYRNLQSETVTYTSDVTMNSGGYCAFRNEAVYHRGRLKVPAGETWQHIIGMEPDAVMAGIPR